MVSLIFGFLVLAIGSVQAGMDEADAALSAGRYEIAIEEYLPIANEGDSAAQFGLASVYLIAPKGIGDRTKALYWAEKSAEQDHIPAVMMLAQFKRGGWGFEKDIPAAKLLLEKAAAHGDSLAQYYYGNGLISGEFGQKDLKQGTDNLLKAAHQNLRTAQYRIAVAFIQHRSGVYYKSMAYMWFNLASSEKFERKDKFAPETIEKIKAVSKGAIAKLEEDLEPGILQVAQKLVAEWSPTDSNEELERRIKLDEFCLGEC